MSDSDETQLTLAPGRRVFGRFVLGLQLGQGGMGTVWEAQDEILNEAVALKFIAPHLGGNPEVLAELKHETARTRRLTHPHIIRIHDLVTDGRLHAIAMELVALPSLPDGRRPPGTLGARKLLQPHGCYSPEDLAIWVVQLASALMYAHHEASIVHRDLKPANLMIDGQSRLKVADFGIAQSLVDTRSQKVADGNTSGTLHYMSPQQLRGRRPAIADDIYAVGATLYDLLTGKPPFFRGDIATQVLEIVPVSLTERRAEFGHPSPALPPGWEKTIAACLAKEAANRPPSANDLLAGLGLRGETPPAPAPSVDPEKTIRVAPAETAKPVPGSATPAGSVAMQPPAGAWSSGGRRLVFIVVIVLLAGSAAVWFWSRSAPVASDAVPANSGANSFAEAVPEPKLPKLPLAAGNRFVGEARQKDGSVFPFALVVDSIDAAGKSLRGRLGDGDPQAAARTFSGALAHDLPTGRWHVLLTTTAREAQPTGGPFSQAQEDWTIDARVESDGSLVGSSSTMDYRLRPWTAPSLPR